MPKNPGQKPYDPYSKEGHIQELKEMIAECTEAIANNKLHPHIRIDAKQTLEYCKKKLKTLTENN